MDAMDIMDAICHIQLIVTERRCDVMTEKKYSILVLRM